jgi:simple sugar transport system ATP-binding protein
MSGDPVMARNPSGGLQVHEVTKAFGETVANDSVTLAVRPGSIHALLGENGAGKSTLVGLINGGHAPDAGEISFDGVPIQPAHGAGVRHGIATVHQDLALVPVMTGLENIALALRRPNDAELRRLAERMQEHVGTHVDLRRPVGELELPQRQRIELIKALCTEPKLLILDEPTTFLPPTETEPFLRLLRTLAEGGLAVLLITHRLDEVTSTADEATVLRHGRVVAHHPGPVLPDKRELARQMVGTSVPAPTRTEHDLGPVVLRTRGLSYVDDGRRLVADIDLEVREGELLGLAGVDGNGQLELLELLAGLRRPTTGSIHLDGEDFASLSLARRVERGLQFVSGDRRKDGIVPEFTVAEHFDLLLGRDPGRDLRAILEQFDVRPPWPKVRGDSLSGGNAQKMVMARALQRRTRVLMVSYPTQGLDVAAAAQLQQLLIEHARSGAAVIVVSSDLEELLTICDTVAVMSAGAIVGRQHFGAYRRDELATWFTQGHEAAA